jgi:hypothetical protein
VQDAALSRIKDYKWWGRLQPHAELWRGVQPEILEENYYPRPVILQSLPVPRNCHSDARSREESAVSLPAESRFLADKAGFGMKGMRCRPQTAAL